MQLIGLNVRETKKLNEQNQARLKLGLPLIQVKQRNCLSCSKFFVSVGERYCKSCGAPKGSTLQHRDVL